MKKNLQFLFSVVTLMLVAVAANAQFADGKYYLQNVESGKYWGAGNSWATQASLVKNPEYVTLISNEDGTYKMESQVSNGGTKYYFAGDFMDSDTPDALTITQSGDNYTISGINGYYGYDGTSTVLGKNLDADSQNALWNIISEEAMIASLANATAENPVDATFFILAPNFGRNNRNINAWNVSEDCTNKNLSGGNDLNRCAESYHSVFTISQTIANAPKGIYKLTAQGFYRQDGENNDNLPVFFMNDATSTFPLKTGTENSMNDASASFSAGLYVADPVFLELKEDGEISLGTKLENNTSLWCIWDNFELTYYGSEASLTEIMLADLIKQVKELREKAAELKNNENIGAGTVTALEAAISASEEIEPTKEAYNEVVATLNAAINQANKDIANKPAIDALYALAEKTNVYTAEAYATYMEWVDGYKAAFDAGTLTESVVNPEVVAGWHSANSFDDLLLSAWTIGGVQAKDFDTALYINTWSTEGNNDGSNFRVPFFEYWTGDGESLGTTTIEATLTDLPVGNYEVTAWVRVRAKNGTAAADATGITLSANGGEAVDVTEGEVVGESQFSLAEYKAEGKVGKDGKLVITFSVADDNNVSWLSFKDVKISSPVNMSNYAVETNNEYDEDGYVAVTVSYDVEIANDYAEDYMDAVFTYEVTDIEGKVVANGEQNPRDITDGTLNIFVPNLKPVTEYTVAITKVAVLDYSRFDFMDPNIDWSDPDLIFAEIVYTEEGTLATQTINVQSYVQLSNYAIECDSIYDNDSEVSVVVTYDTAIGGTYKNSMFIEAQFAYEVSDAEGNIVVSNTIKHIDVAEGSFKFYVAGLEAQTEYTITITDVKVTDLDLNSDDLSKTVYKEKGTLATKTFSAIPTGIANVEAAPSVKADGKYLENGQIVIYRGGVKYNAAGAVIR